MGYRLTGKGNKAALLFALFHNCVCGPLAHSLFNPPPSSQSRPATKIEVAHRRVIIPIEQVLRH